MSITGNLIASAMAGLAFVGCGTTAWRPRRHPRPDAAGCVQGKRVKTIDIHAHCIVPAAAAIINHPLEAPGLLMTDTLPGLARWTRRASSRGTRHQPLLYARNATPRPN